MVAPPQRRHTGRGTSTSRPAATYASTDNGQGHTIATGGNTALDPLPRQRPTDREGVPRVTGPPILTGRHPPKRPARPRKHRDRLGRLRDQEVTPPTRASKAG